MKTFEIKTWLGENRDVIIAKYNNLTSNKFYNGITLKNFMIEILNAMVRNNVKSEKRAAKLLPQFLDDTFYKNSSISTPNSIDDKIRNKYTGTSYMALV